MKSEKVESTIGKLLIVNGLTLATAESCTGGLISDRLTDIPGSSQYYLGGVVVYSNEAKMRLVGVHEQTLIHYGAVSEETVIEMARGVRQALQADIGISVSGIAGPGGGTPDKPVGLVWIGLSGPDIDQAWRYLWQGGRRQVKEQSAEQALINTAEYLHALT